MNSKMLNKIKAAWQKRVSQLPENTTCFRVVDAEGDGCPGLWLEWLAGRLLFQTTDKLTISAKDAEDVLKLLNARSVYWKRLDQYLKESPQWLYGKRVGQPFTVLENGVSYELDFSSGYSQGIFLDQRDNRLLLRERAAQKAIDNPRVLNLFSYTCAFSVAAALGGAVTTSVDLSAAYLEWGKRNFTLNAVDHTKHFFVKGDAFDWLQAFAKKGHKWNGVVLDPPTFSRGEKKKVFRVEEDYAELVRLSTLVLEPGGWLLCSANTRAIHSLLLEDQICQGVKDAGRKLLSLKSVPMPLDFPGDPYLKSFWLDLN